VHTTLSILLGLHSSLGTLPECSHPNPPVFFHAFVFFPFLIPRWSVLKLGKKTLLSPLLLCPPPSRFFFFLFLARGGMAEVGSNLPPFVCTARLRPLDPYLSTLERSDFLKPLFFLLQSLELLQIPSLFSLSEPFPWERFFRVLQTIPQPLLPPMYRLLPSPFDRNVTTPLHDPTQLLPATHSVAGTLSLLPSLILSFLLRILRLFTS